jgi:hypothetical protein
MARWWIGLLVLLNAALLAWNMGALAPWGWGTSTAQDGPVVTLPFQSTASEPASDAASAASAPASATPAVPPKPPASAARPKPVAAPAAAASAPESN